MMTLQLPPEIEREFKALAASTGVSASVHAERAIVEYLGDLQDYAAAEREVEEIAAGRSTTVPLAEAMQGVVGARG